MNRAQRRRPLQQAWAISVYREPLRSPEQSAQAETILRRHAHDFDDDATCIKCGFDGAEWHHLKSLGYDYGPEPLCNGGRS